MCVLSLLRSLALVRRFQLLLLAPTRGKRPFLKGTRAPPGGPLSGSRGRRYYHWRDTRPVFRRIPPQTVTLFTIPSLSGACDTRDAEL